MNGLNRPNRANQGCGPDSAFSVRREEIVTKTNLIYAAAPLIFTLAAGCSAISGEKKDSNDAASGSGDVTTVTGCLSTDANGRYALTAAPDATGAMASRMVDDNDRDTKSYLLMGGENLQAHLGKKVEVTGRVSGKTLDMEHKAGNETQQPPATGGDHNQPTVKTEEEIDLEARQFTVQTIRDVAGTCTVTQ
jgi:hypothetical protein